MKKKGYILVIIALLSLTLNWLPEIAHAQKEATETTYTTATTSELMEMFLPYSIQDPYIETTKNSAELMFVTETAATITAETNNETQTIAGSTENHQFTLDNLQPGNNLVTITATMAGGTTESKTITINLPEKPKKGSKSFHDPSKNQMMTQRKKGHLL
ncbi:carboxypeptidase-like regulatory domain-containing protein [Listeria cossartiae]|uniref:Carboxypeptidase-like regulatory domain-containing protein n=1 Tax=Listeria cossartiae subsp. cayugensis TaxID=2713505 RepID=A0ABU2IMG6_9LIST|nr:carboxypeptidase-like regulatory domain-containing protein [Listeria cossartiae]MCD2224206.1 carboxypeptidase-like regulatory domain-containing protein [Listeria cossartiae]MCD2238883.1 carboxypeptidase-like regulatory domain-containing protein [Listeria cossartiae]MDT0048896.1 carboxypeptidase-like regulatory domain-containing protein [Listeria cossartiae subsp. cayugensis]MDT0065399.1 carboxypeptidase-like regulatory domain-containing protein [Listeria cossartiae subsp. cayugensis]MDT0078